MTFRDEAYDRIFALWRVQSPYSQENSRGEGGINSSNEEDDAKLPNAAANGEKFEKQQNGNTEEIQSITKSEEDSKLEPLDSNLPRGILEESKTLNNSTASRMRRA